jgi:hypothetical protein
MVFKGIISVFGSCSVEIVWANRRLTTLTGKISGTRKKIDFFPKKNIYLQILQKIKII